MPETPALQFKDNSWLVYLLECADGTIYCGITSNLSRRLDQHNGLLPGGARYTSGRRPVRLCAAVGCKDKRTALSLERKVKSQKRQRKFQLLLSRGICNAKP